MCVVQARGQRENEVRAHKNIFGIATIHGVSRESRLVAEILHAMMAKRAIAIHASHPRNTNTGFRR